ncbi:MAG TPA: hypothetical protein VF131_16445 [Blastocatellia bacterium]|nr:hypothetical protein [Blastocatellia bacterium]
MLKLTAVALVSAITGMLAALAMLFITSGFSQGGEPVSAEDVLGIASLTFAPALIKCGLLYAPVLLWLRRRHAGCEPRQLFLLVPAFVLNLPAFILLIVSGLRGTGFAGFQEISLFLIAFIVTGLMFGAGFIRYCRMRSVATT